MHACIHTYIHASYVADAVATPGDDALDVGWFSRDEVEQQSFGLVGPGLVQVYIVLPCTHIYAFTYIHIYIYIYRCWASKACCYAIDHMNMHIYIHTHTIAGLQKHAAMLLIT
jgi:hypothetical protein